MMKFAVITGGSYSGKTTLINHLASLGYHTVPEAAILVIEELNRRLGIERQKEWRQTHMAEFQLLIAEKQALLESDASTGSGGCVFLDRGLPDGVAYCRLYKITPPAQLSVTARARRYEAVFILATLRDFSLRGESGRMSDYDASRRVSTLIEEVYCELGYTCFRLAEAPTAARAELVLRTLKLIEGEVI